MMAFVTPFKYRGLGRLKAGALLLGLCFGTPAEGQWIDRSPAPSTANLNGLHFPDGKTGYAVGEKSSILKTVDGGSTWIPVSGHGSVHYLSTWFTSPETGFAVGWGGIISWTRDGGKTWDHRKSPLEPELRSVHFPTPDVGFAVGSKGIILRTLDGGASDWKVHELPSKPSLASVRFANASVGYTVGGKGAAFKTADGGVSWDSLSIGTGQDLGYIRVFGPDSCLVIGDSGITLTTGNGGATWNRTPGGTPIPRAHPAYFLDGRRGFAFLDSDPYRTTDGGGGWYFSKNPMDNYMMQMDFASPDTGIAVGTAGAILRTVNGGADWKTVSHPESGYWRHVWNVGPMEAVVIGGYGLLRTVDGGETWRLQEDFFGYAIGSLQFPVPDVGYAGGSTGRIYKTVDRGARWTLMPASTGSDISHLCFQNKDTGYALTREALLRTTDGAKSWVVQYLMAGVPIGSRIEFPTLDTGYAFGGDLYWYRTTDAGIHWERKTNPTKRRLNDFHFLTGKSGFAVGAMNPDSGTAFIAKTDDAGETWTLMRTGYRTDFNLLQFLDARTGYMAGADGSIVSTRDGGVTWNTNISATGFPINSFHFTGAGAGYAVGGDGIVFQLQQGPVSGIGPIPTAPPFEAGWTGYPWYRLHRGSSVRIRLFDARGKRVLDWPRETLPAGYHQARPPAFPLPGGRYFLDIHAEGARRTIPIRNP